MRCGLVGIILLLFCIPVAYSATNETIFTFRDVTNNQLIENVAIYLTIGSFTYSYFLPKDGVLKVYNLDANSDIIIRADDFSTPGNDYYQILEKGSITSNIANPYLMPVGSIRGIVKDSLANIVPHAKLKFESNMNQQFNFPTETDEFGSFFIDYAPVGQYRIYASYGEATGAIDLYIGHGNLSNVEITLDKSIIITKKQNNVIWLIPLAVIFIAALILYFFIRKKEKPEESKVEEVPLSTNEVTNKILQTLNAKERKVVEYLMQNNNAAQQSAVRHATSTPRTTLTRLIISLEQKKILKVEKHGKSVKLYLTDFFLGNE